MIVWEIVENADKFSRILPSGEFDWISFSDNFDGSRIEDDITSEKFKFKDTKMLKVGDFPHLSPGILVVSSKAYEMISVYKREVQTIPFKVGENQYYLGNVVNVIDCLDYDKSIIKNFPNSDKILRIKNFSFNQEKLEGETLFKIPELNTSRIFVTREFIKSYEDNSLEGLVFNEVWDSDK